MDFGEQHFLTSGSWNNPATPTTKILSTKWEGFFVFVTKMVSRKVSETESAIKHFLPMERVLNGFAKQNEGFHGF
jgi:hypothetical protein